MKKKRELTLKQRQMLFGYLFIAPWLIGFLVFFASNLVEAIIYSVSKITINENGGFSLTYIGLDNYKYAFMQHASFNRTLAESVGNSLLDVVLIIPFSLLMAIFLNKRFKGRGLIRAIFFLPVIMASPAITAAIDSTLQAVMGGVASSTGDFQQTTGFNITSMVYMFVDLGVPDVLIDYLVGAVGRVYEIVRSSGVQILIFLAALQSISPALYEVAKIEGATTYESFWKVTFPMVSPLIVTNVVYTIVDLYAQTEVVELASTVAFTEQNFGLSSVMSLVSSGCICLALVIICALISKKVFYQS